MNEKFGCVCVCIFARVHIHGYVCLSVYASIYVYVCMQYICACIRVWKCLYAEHFLSVENSYTNILYFYQW